MVEGIARTIFSKIRAEEETDYPECTKEWLTSDEFRELNQDKYIERNEAIGDMENADDSRLWDAYYRLVDAEIVKEIKGLKLFWSKEESVSKDDSMTLTMKSSEYVSISVDTILRNTTFS